MKLTIKVKMKDRWIPHFLGMLQRMELVGNLGCSKVIGMYADGDGDFRPKFIVDKELEIARPVYDDDCKNKDAICDVFYDAG